MGILVVFLLFALSCILGLIVPPLGVAAFYFFNLLDPVWNWRWDIAEDPGFQKWLAVVLLVGYFQNRAWQYKFSRFSVYAIVCITTYLLLSYISSFFSYYPEKCNQYLDFSWRIILVVAISLLLVVDENWAMILAVGCILGQAYNAYQINLEYLQVGYCRYITWTVWGFKGLDNNGYSILTLPVMALSMGMILGPWKWWIRAIVGPIFVIQMHQIMVFESRGTMLGAMLMALIAIWYCPKSFWTNLAILGGIGSAAFLAGPSVVKEFTSSFMGRDQLDSSAESRFHLWEAGAALLWDYPILGVGPGCSSSHVPLYYKYEKYEPGTLKALHNLFFEVMCENGIPAGIFYFAFFLLPWISVWIHRKRFLHGNARECSLALAVIAGIPGYFLASMFSSGSLIESGYVLPIIGCALLSIRLKADADEEADILSETSSKSLAIPVSVHS